MHSFDDAILQFEDKLHKMETHPMIINTMSLTLFAGEHGKFEDHIDTNDEDDMDITHNIICAAAREQDQIGWHNFLEGKTSSKWTMVQEQYYCEDPQQRKSSSSWASKIIIYFMTSSKDSGYTEIASYMTK